MCIFALHRSKKHEYCTFTDLLCVNAYHVLPILKCCQKIPFCFVINKLVKSCDLILFLISYTPHVSGQNTFDKTHLIRIWCALFFFFQEYCKRIIQEYIEQTQHTRPDLRTEDIIFSSHCEVA